MKSPITPKSQIKNVLRKLWMWSRERREAIKQQGNTCQRCKRKGSKKKGEEIKIDVHHKTGDINWRRIEQVLYEELLVSPDKLECLCVECHKQETNGNKV